jgi:diguanylate cyclase (GGDEF)-like protein
MLEAESGCKVSTSQVMLGEALDEPDANEWTLVRKDGSRLVVNMLTTSVRDEQERQIGHLAICLDITEAKRVEEELRVLSITDSLTGIYNRRYFQERLKSEVARAAREGLSLSVIMLDIDHFKQINDQHGHAQGDRVLQAFCQHIGQRLRRTDVFCRLGGEEFMVLCPGSNSDQAYHLAVELWQGLRSVVVDGVGVVTASFGLACWRPGEGADALLLRADSGVYAAKQAGRDRVQPELR